jgi:hypothetical protein
MPPFDFHAIKPRRYSRLMSPPAITITPLPVLPLRRYAARHEDERGALSGAPTRESAAMRREDATL